VRIAEEKTLFSFDTHTEMLLQDFSVFPHTRKGTPCKNKALSENSKGSLIKDLRLVVLIFHLLIKLFYHIFRYL
jgi:hypothetical protein